MTVCQSVNREVPCRLEMLGQPGFVGQKRVQPFLQVKQLRRAHLARARQVDFQDLGDAAVGRAGHQHDTVGQQQRLLQVVGHHQHRGAAGVPGAQQLVLHQAPGLCVQRRKRLVEQQQAWLQGQCPGQSDALAHAAGQCRRPVPGEFGQAHVGKQLLGAPGGRFTVQPAVEQGDGNVFHRTHPREQVVLLEDQRTVGLVAAHCLAVVQQVPGAGLLQARSDVEQGALAAPAAPQQHGETGGLDIQVTHLDPCAAFELLAQATKTQRGAPAHDAHPVRRRPSNSIRRSTTKPTTPMVITPTITNGMLYICWAMMIM